MKILAVFSGIALLAMTFCSPSAQADAMGAGFLGSFPFYSGDYPYYDGAYPPAPLYAPYGYYGCRAGCCRRAVWRGQHWHNVTTCDADIARSRHNIQRDD
jgi:hypothetical protein